MKVKIEKELNKTTIYIKSIFNKFEILNQINSIDDYEITKAFFPGFNEDFNYDNFIVFPYYDENIRINGCGKNIKLIFKTIEEFDLVAAPINQIDYNNQQLILNDLLKLYNSNIPYGIYYIYEFNSILYLIATTYNNQIIILNKADSLNKLFNQSVKNQNIFNFHPLSLQGVKYIYNNDKITGVVNGIGTI